MWNYNQTPEPNELYHWGILGMKWGVRRYQNKDGSLTPAGKKRYDDEQAHDDYKKARSKSTREMTDAELQMAIRRLQMEQQYNNLNPRKVSRGEKISNAIVKAAGGVALEAGKQLAKDAIIKKGKSYLGLDDKKDDFATEAETLKKIIGYNSARETYKKQTGMDWSWNGKTRP